MKNGIPELDALLEESTKREDDLDELMAESLKLTEEEKAVKFLREKQKRGGLTKAEREDDEARIREWEAKREWDTKANIGVFNKAVCTCGNVSITWSHLMHMQVHKEKRVIRHVRAKVEVAALPNQIAYQVVTVDCCIDCARDKGWDLNQAPASVWILD